MNRVCKILILIWSSFCLIGLLIWLANLSTIEVTSSYEEIGFAVGTVLGVGFWLILWLFPTVILALIGFLIQPAKKTKVKLTVLCPHCGKYYEGVPVFCPHCGIKLK